MWCPLPAPVVGRGRLATPGRHHDLGKRHSPEPRKYLPAKQLRVVDRARIGPVPLRECSLTCRDGGTTASPDLGRLRWVSGDARLAANVAWVSDGSAALG